MYFISKDNKKEGPLSLEEVKKLKLTEEILVWKDGLTNWVNIKEIPELKDLVTIAPPLLPLELEEEKRKKFQKFKHDKGKKIIFRNFLIGLPIGFLLAANHLYQATHQGNSDWDNWFPIYLSDEERENPILIFWQMLPYSLLVGQIIMSLVSAFQIYRIKPLNQKVDGKKETHQLSYKKDYKNKLIHILKNEKMVESISIREFIQRDKTVLDVEVLNGKVFYGSRAWLDCNLAKDGLYEINANFYIIANGKVLKD